MISFWVLLLCRYMFKKKRKERKINIRPHILSLPHANLSLPHLVRCFFSFLHGWLPSHHRSTAAARATTCDTISRATTHGRSRCACLFFSTVFRRKNPNRRLLSPIPGELATVLSTHDHQWTLLTVRNKAHQTFS